MKMWLILGDCKTRAPSLDQSIDFHSENHRPKRGKGANIDDNHGHDGDVGKGSRFGY